MRFWPKWGSNKQLPRIERKAVLGTSDSLGSFLIFGTKGAETPAAALNLYDKSTAVSIPVNKVAEPFASINPVLQIEDKVITDHPILELLRNPSPLYDGYTFCEALAKYYLVTGDVGLIALGGVNRPPLELQPISPANVTVTEGQGGIAALFSVSGNTLAGSYDVEHKRGRVRYFNGGLREFKLIRNFSIRNNSLLRGRSLLVSASAEARQHILGNEYNTSILEKGGRVSVVFHFDEDLNDDDFEVLKERVRSEYGGASKAGEVAVTSGGKLKIEELSKNNKDMDFVKLQQAAKNACALTYGVPLALVSNDAAKFDNFKISTLSLYDIAVLPLADRLFAGLSVFLLPRYGLDPAKARITYNILSITALRERVLEELKTRKEINIESTNELRTQIAIDPIQGGDSVLVPANLIPLGSELIDEEPDPVIEREEPDADLDEDEDLETGE